MKNTIIRLLPALCITISATAFSQPVDYQAVIKANFEATKSVNYIGGSLLIDGRKDTMDLSLQPRMPECAVDTMCAQMMPEPVTYLLENSTTDIDECGVIRTSAKFDKRPVDGIYLSVVATNYSHNTCPTVSVLPAMEIKVKMKRYDRLQGKEVVSLDKFEAQDMSLIKPAN